MQQTVGLSSTAGRDRPREHVRFGYLAAMLAAILAASRAPVAPRPSRRLNASAALALALVAATMGCSDGTSATPTPAPVSSATAHATPVGSPTPTRAPAPTPTPTQDATPDFDAIDLKVLPPRPSALDEPPSEQGAAAVATYFVLLYAYASATYDLEAFRELAYGDCGFCNRALDDFSRYRADGTKVEGGAIVVHDADASLLSDDYYIVTTTMSQQASREVTASGKVLEESEGFTARPFEVDVKWYDGSWYVMAVNN